MSGLPHPFEPVTHVTEWREDGVASVRWCGVKYLFNAELVLNPGETKPCPVCGMELHHDEKKKEVVEGGFPWSGGDGGGDVMLLDTSMAKIYGGQARRWSQAWKKAAKRGEVDGEALCVLQNAWAEQGARIAELEKMLLEVIAGIQPRMIVNGSLGAVAAILFRIRDVLGEAK